MFFFSGVFFPLSNFPEIVGRISMVIPLTPVVIISRALVSGKVDAGLLGALGIVVVLAVLFFSVALVTMRRRLTV